MTFPARLNPPRTSKPNKPAPRANNVSLISVEMTFLPNDSKAFSKFDGNEVKPDQSAFNNPEFSFPSKLSNSCGNASKIVEKSANLRTRLRAGIPSQSGKVKPLKINWPTRAIAFKIVVINDINLSPAPNNNAAINGKIKDIKFVKPKKLPANLIRNVGIASRFASNKPAFNSNGTPNKNNPIGPWVITPLTKLMMFINVPMASAGNQLIKSLAI